MVIIVVSRSKIANLGDVVTQPGLGTLTDQGAANQAETLLPEATAEALLPKAKGRCPRARKHTHPKRHNPHRGRFAG